jgi:hypothetical protein
MQADEAADFMDKDKETDTFKRNAAIVIAIFAMLLAITGLGGGNSTKDAINENIAASNDFNFYQAKTMRQTSLMLAANEIELAWSAGGNLSEEAKAALKKKLDEYRATIARYESEPSTGEGKKELLARAKQHSVNRDRALQQDPYFDYSQALLQIAIVLISVSIVAELFWLAALGGVLGILGTLLMVNGFLLLVAIPGLS